MTDNKKMDTTSFSNFYHDGGIDSGTKMEHTEMMSGDTNEQHTGSRSGESMPGNFAKEREQSSEVEEKSE